MAFLPDSPKKISPCPFRSRETRLHGREKGETGRNVEGHCVSGDMEMVIGGHINERSRLCYGDNGGGNRSE